jgi:histidine ammonia-lyase
MTDNLFSIIGIELLSAAQGIDLRRPLATSPQLETVHRLVRGSVAVLDNDRYMADDLQVGTQLVASGRVGTAGGSAVLATLGL